MTRQQFEAIWSLEDLPFCPVGMAILYRLSEQRADLLDWLPEVQFQPSKVPFQGDPLWQTLLHHVEHCDDCTER